jgi:hypothetical protein
MEWNEINGRKGKISMEGKERCYSFVLSQRPHEPITEDTDSPPVFFIKVFL